MRGIYNWGYQVFEAGTLFNQHASEREKLTMILKNPAALKVFALQCDLFSMGKVLVKDREKNVIEDDPFTTLLQEPNPLTKTESQFLFDFMFNLMLGTAYCYVDSAVPDKMGGNMMYFLDASKIEWPREIEKRKDKMIFSQSELKKMLNTTITYRYEDGTVFTFPLSRLVMSFDLTNGLGNFFKGVSRVDALYKIISNAEYTLDADNINIRYSGKFMVGSENKMGTTSMQRPMEDSEKQDIIDKIETDRQNTFPIKSKVNIARFVSDMASLQLSEKYLAAYFLIGNMYNIPRDVLEAFNSATYENQEKARAAHVNYTLEPKGNQFMDAFEVFFGYRQQGKNIVISWDHLPFMQVFAKEAIGVKQETINALSSLLQLGISLDKANEYLGTTFEIDKPEPVAAEAEGGQGEASQAAGGQAAV